MSNHLQVHSKAAFNSRVDTYATNDFHNEYDGHLYLDGQSHHVDLPNAENNFVKIRAESTLNGMTVYLSGINAGDEITIGGALGDSGGPNDPYFTVKGCKKQDFSDFANPETPWSPADCTV